jgi:hypothetical protein
MRDGADRQRPVAVQRPAQRIQHAAKPVIRHRQRRAVVPAGRSQLELGGALPGPSPSRAPNGIACARPWRKPTISAATRLPSRASSSRRSPTQTCPLNPSISTTRPDNPVTRPSTRSGAMSRSPARHAATRSRVGVRLICERCLANVSA